MSPEFTFIAQKRHDGYRFIAKQYGVVVSASDAASGIRELEARIEAVKTQFREAGVDIDELKTGERQAGKRGAFWPALSLFIAKVVVVMVVAALLLFPAVGFFSKKIQAMASRASLTAVLEHPGQLIVRLGNRIDSAPPETIQELKLAVRKILVKMGPVMTEARELMDSKQDAKPNGDPPASR